MGVKDPSVEIHAHTQVGDICDKKLPTAKCLKSIFPQSNVSYASLKIFLFQTQFHLEVHKQFQFQHVIDSCS